MPSQRSSFQLRFPSLPAVGSCHMGRHVISTWIGMSFLMGNINSDWRVDLEIGYGGWNRAPDFDRAPLTQALEGDLPVVGGLASELDLEVRKDGWDQRGFFGYVQATVIRGNSPPRVT